MALVVFGTLSGVALLVIYVPPLVLAWVSIVLTVTGFVVGVPAGAYYHVVLRRELLKLGPLPRRWYMRPHSLHGLLEASAIGRVFPWFAVGGAGFMLILVGFALALVVLITSGPR